MTKTKVYRLATLMLVLTLISTVMISGTFAKYTSEYSGQDTALVARWSFGLEAGQEGDLDAVENAEQELNLFDHEFDTYINQNATTGEFIIAPGVSGEFVVDMKYLADVAADVKIVIEPSDDNIEVDTAISDGEDGYESIPVPVEYSVNGTDWVTLDDLAKTLVEFILLKGEEDGDYEEYGLEEISDGVFRISEVAADSIIKLIINETIEWRWPHEASSAVYEGSTNATDTAFGEAAAAKGLPRIPYGIKITVTATQVIPE